MRYGLEVGSGSIGKQDHGELSLREPRDARGEAHRLTVVPYFFETMVIPNKPAESITRTRELGLSCRSERVFEQLPRYQPGRVKRLVPSVEIGSNGMMMMNLATSR